MDIFFFKHHFLTPDITLSGDWLLLRRNSWHATDEYSWSDPDTTAPPSISIPAFAQEESQSWRTRCSTDSKCSSSPSSSSSSASFRSAAGWFSRRDLKRKRGKKTMTDRFRNVTREHICTAVPSCTNRWGRCWGQQGARGSCIGSYCSVSMWAEREQPNGCARRLAPSHAAVRLPASKIYIFGWTQSRVLFHDER